MSDAVDLNGSVGEVIREAASLLDVAWARIDAELLMAHALGCSRSAMLLHHMGDPVPDAFAPLFARRLAYEPVAYITGSAEFYGLELKVTPAVLIPRGDSETLIDAAQDHFAPGEPPQRILDLGTGSGALLLAALAQWPQAKGWGIDASAPALAVAQANAARLALADRAAFRIGDWAQEVEGPFDLLLINPPYIGVDEPLSGDVLREPANALFAGADGLDDYRRIAPDLPRLIAPGGMAAIEIGHRQGDSVGALVAAQGLSVAIRHDLAGLDRCVIATRT